MSITAGEAIGAALVAGAGAEATGLTNYTPIGSDDDSNQDDPGSPASGIQTALAALSGRDAGSSVSEALIGQLTDAARSGGTRIIERQVREIGKQPGALSDGISRAVSDNAGQQIAPEDRPNGYFDILDRVDPTEDNQQQQQDTQSQQAQGDGWLANATRNVGYGIGNTPFALAGGAIDAGRDRGQETREWLADNDSTTDSDDTGLLSSARRNIDRIAGSVGITNDPMPGYLGSSGSSSSSNGSTNSYSQENGSSSSSGGGNTVNSSASLANAISGGSSGGSDSGNSTRSGTSGRSVASSSTPMPGGSGGDPDSSDSGGSSGGNSTRSGTSGRSVSSSSTNDSSDSGGSSGGGAISNAVSSVSDTVGSFF